MKLAIISDLHYGARQDYLPYLENNRRFFKEVFFPKIDELDIRHVVCLGDLLDRRKYINILTADYLQKDFLIPLRSREILFDWILGNHDIYYRESMKVNGSVIWNLSNTAVYDRAFEVPFEGNRILFVPWICKENQEHAYEMIAKTDAKILFGHLELQNFQMTTGSFNKDGMNPEILEKFDVVLTGHFHPRQSKYNILYVGTHAQLEWGDCDQDRGFHIFDTETYDIEFIKNPFKVFQKVYYDDSPGQSDAIPLDLHGKIIKVIVSSKNDTARYERFIHEVEKQQPLEVKIVEDHLKVKLFEDNDIVSQTKDTLGIIREFVKQANNVVNTDKLDNLIVGLFKEAQEAQE